LKLTKSKNKKFGENINSNYTDLIKPDKTEIYGKNLIKFKNEKLNEWIINNSLEKELLGFYCENNYGDGIFDIYKSANMYLILSADVQQLMNQLDNEYFNEIF
jgi:pectate lyase